MCDQVGYAILCIGDVWAGELCNALHRRCVMIWGTQSSAGDVWSYVEYAMLCTGDVWSGGLCNALQEMCDHMVYAMLCRRSVIRWVMQCSAGDMWSYGVCYAMLCTKDVWLFSLRDALQKMNDHMGYAMLGTGDVWSCGICWLYGVCDTVHRRCISYLNALCCTQDVPWKHPFFLNVLPPTLYNVLTNIEFRYLHMVLMYEL